MREAGRAQESSGWVWRFGGAKLKEGKTAEANLQMEEGKIAMKDWKKEAVAWNTFRVNFRNWYELHLDRLGLEAILETCGWIEKRSIATVTIVESRFCEDLHTVERYPAPVDMENLPLFAGLYLSISGGWEWDSFHQHIKVLRWCYPSVFAVLQCRDALYDSTSFTETEMFLTSHRTWKFSSSAARGGKPELRGIQFDCMLTLAVCQTPCTTWGVNLMNLIGKHSRIRWLVVWPYSFFIQKKILGEMIQFHEHISLQWVVQPTTNLT